MQTPDQLVWNEGPLPDVFSTGPNSKILAWIVCDFPHANGVYQQIHGQLKDILLISPSGDEFNALAWRDRNLFPIGLNEKVTHWAWVIQDPKEPNVSWKTNGL